MTISMGTRWLFQVYNIQDTSYRYGKFDEYFTMAEKMVKTSGASTTVTSYTAASAALAPVDIADEIAVYRDGATDNRIVVTNADDDTITVGSNVDWTTGRAYHYRKFRSGTAATDGWVTKDPHDSLTIQIIITTIGATSIEYRIEGRMRGFPEAPVILVAEVTKTTTDTPFAATHIINEEVDEIRVGFKQTGAGTNSVSAAVHFPKIDP